MFAVQDAKPAQIQRRVTLVRFSSMTGEEDTGVPSEQRQPAAPSRATEPEMFKKKKAKVVRESAQQPGAVELRLEDIMVKQVWTQQKHLDWENKGKASAGSKSAIL